MEKRTKRKARGQGRGQVRRYRVVREQVTAEQRVEIVKDRLLRRSCFDCVFCISNVLLWAQTLMSGFPVGGQCANHPDTPGRVRPVPYGGTCRNFRAKVPPPVRVEPPEPPNDKVRYISLTRGLYAIVDAEDYGWLSRYKWHASSRDAPYAYCTVNGKNIAMHRMIMRPPKGMVVDHINGNGLDNRRCNLRVCRQDQNMRNSRRHVGGKSRFRGVFPRGHQWEAKVTYKGKEYYLGRFNSELEAAEARDRLASKLFGKYAWLNIPPGSPEAGGH